MIVSTSTVQKRKRKVNFAAKNESESEFESSDESSSSEDAGPAPSGAEGAEKEGSDRDDNSEIEYSDEDNSEHEVDDEDELRDRIEQSRENMKFLMQSFSNSQLQRYETFRRAGLQRSTVKKLVQSVLGQTVNPNAIIVCAGVAKVFVGELIEEARVVMQEWNESGPLCPSHIREAYRRLKKNGQAPHSSLSRKRLQL